MPVSEAEEPELHRDDRQRSPTRAACRSPPSTSRPPSSPTRSRRAATPSTRPSRSPRASSARCRPASSRACSPTRWRTSRTATSSSRASPRWWPAPSPAIANFLQFSLFFGGDDDDSPLGIIGTLATIILAPIAAMIIQLAVSRQREYVADATGAELLGDPLPLADALETLHRGAEAIPMKVNPAVGAALHRQPARGQRPRRPGRRLASCSRPTRRWRSASRASAAMAGAGSLAVRTHRASDVGSREEIRRLDQHRVGASTSG